MFYRLFVELEKPGSFAARESCLHDMDSPVAQHNLKDDAFPDFEPEFSPVLLSGDSSLVDLIHDGSAIGGHGLLVSEKVLSILEKMKMPPYQPYALEVVHKGKSMANRYFWLQILALNNYDWIDFAKSEFSLKHHFDMDDSRGAPVRITSSRELQETIEAERDSFVLFARLTLNGVYARSPFDLFYLERLGGLAGLNPIISERLKAAFEREGVVGYALRRLPHIVIDEGK